MKGNQTKSAPPAQGQLASEHTIISVEGLQKQYSGRPAKAVDGISFAVNRGDVFGLLGPNGAGKTTTIGVLTTRVMPTGGRAIVAGTDVVRDPVGVKPYIAVVPQRNNLDRSLNAKENLTFHAAYFGMNRSARMERAARLLDQFGLAARANDQVITYSGGMAQRLLICRALMHDPELLFLDEPTTGLDPQSRLFLWEMIETLNRDGLTILLTTHDMEEAEKLCHRVAIMDHGKILAMDTPANLGRLVPAGTRVELRTRRQDGKAPPEEDRLAILSLVKSLDGVITAEWAEADGGESSPGVPSRSAGSGPPGAWGSRPKNGHAGAAPSAPPGPSATIAPGAPGAPVSNDEDQVPLLRLYVARGGEVAVRAAQIVLSHGLELADMHLARPSLEDVFIHLTGKGLRD
ncbi:MAG TPA: ATP-binding cassette domain-containing protein [Blastocatellia bacterium]|nr:ATP-binding cassette domain-containing protein [Blastocatellia bacterium]